MIEPSTSTPSVACETSCRRRRSGGSNPKVTAGTRPGRGGGRPDGGGGGQGGNGGRGGRENQKAARGHPADGAGGRPHHGQPHADRAATPPQRTLEHPLQRPPPGPE